MSLLAFAKEIARKAAALLLLISMFAEAAMAAPQCPALTARDNLDECVEVNGGNGMYIGRSNIFNSARVKAVAQPHNNDYFNPRVRVYYDKIWRISLGLPGLSIPEQSEGEGVVELDWLGGCDVIYGTGRVCARVANPGTRGNPDPLHLALCVYEDPPDFADNDLHRNPFHYRTTIESTTTENAETSRDVAAGSLLLLIPAFAAATVLLPLVPVLYTGLGALAVTAGLVAGFSEVVRLAASNPNHCIGRPSSSWDGNNADEFFIRMRCGRDGADDEGVLGCIRLPLAPYPPPFCPNIVSVVPSPYISVICEQGDDPKVKGCVYSYIYNQPGGYPANFANKVYSKFERPLIRVSFDKVIPLCPNNKAPTDIGDSGSTVLEEFGPCVKVNNNNPFSQTRDFVPDCSVSSGNETCIIAPSNIVSPYYRAIAQSVTATGTPISNIALVDDHNNLYYKINGINIGDFRDVGFSFNYASGIPEAITLQDAASEPRARQLTTSMVASPRNLCVEETLGSGETVSYGCYQRPQTPKPVVEECNGRCVSTHTNPRMWVKLGNPEQGGSLGLNETITLHGIEFSASDGSDVICLNGVNTGITMLVKTNPDGSPSLDPDDVLIANYIPGNPIVYDDGSPRIAPPLVNEGEDATRIINSEFETTRAQTAREAGLCVSKGVKCPGFTVEGFYIEGMPGFRFGELTCPETDVGGICERSTPEGCYFSSSVSLGVSYTYYLHEHQSHRCLPEGVWERTRFRAFGVKHCDGNCLEQCRANEGFL